MIQELLGVERELVSVEGVGVEAEADWEHLRTPETYLGYGRGSGFASANGHALDEPRLYELPDRLRSNGWALAGEWTIGREKVVLEQAGGSIAFRFDARDAHLVLSTVSARADSRSACSSTASLRVARTASTSTRPETAFSRKAACTSSFASTARSASGRWRSPSANQAPRRTRSPSGNRRCDCMPAAGCLAAGLFGKPLLRRHATSDPSTTRSGQRGSAAGPTSSGLRLLVGRDAELERLGELLAAVGAGGSAALVVRGEPGVGKSALLEQLIASASGFQVVRADGVEGEVDLPYAGLQQLCRSMTDAIGCIAATAVRRAARCVRPLFRQGSRPVHGRTRDSRPHVRSRRGAASPVRRRRRAVARSRDDASAGVRRTPSRRRFRRARLRKPGDRRGARRRPGAAARWAEHGRLARPARLGARSGTLDGTVRERFLAETHGNPLALIELPRAMTSAEAATGIVRQSHDSLSARIEDSFRRQLEPLPADTRQLLLLAAAEPLGDPLLLVNAAAQLGLSIESADPAEEAGLFEIRERCSFRHPLVRSAVYGAATPGERRVAHGAIAEATDPKLDADRRAWHRAQATPAPDEDVATELERTAARAKARGGLAAAGAFLERAAMLTPDAGKRTERTLAAAEVMYEAGRLRGRREPSPCPRRRAPRRAPGRACREPRRAGRLVPRPRRGRRDPQARRPRANGSPTSIPGSRTRLTWKRCAGLSTFRTPMSSALSRTR